MFANIAQSVYHALVVELRKGGAASRQRKKLLRKARRLLLKLGDPDIVIPLDGFAFKTPLSSNIILFHFEFKFYDSTLPRLASAVREARGKLVMVDVGANIGAATYLVSRKTAGHFFCVEASPRFKTCLNHNLGQIPNSQARFAALTDQPQRLAVRHNYIEGNSNIEAAAGGEALEFITLDSALAAKPEYGAPNLVKIDTEGFELKILRGAARTLAEYRPPLFFEFFPAFIRREGGEPDALFDLLRQHGYEHFIFYDGVGHLLTSLSGGEAAEQFQSLRRYCELQSSFFDVAAFHSSDVLLGRRFLAAENELFERNLRPQHPTPKT